MKRSSFGLDFHSVDFLVLSSPSFSLLLASPRGPFPKQPAGETEGKGHRRGSTNCGSLTVRSFLEERLEETQSRKRRELPATRYDDEHVRRRTVPGGDVDDEVRADGAGSRSRKPLISYVEQRLLTVEANSSSKSADTRTILTEACGE